MKKFLSMSMIVLFVFSSSVAFSAEGVSISPPPMGYPDYDFEEPPPVIAKTDTTTDITIDESTAGIMAEEKVYPTSRKSGRWDYISATTKGDDFEMSITGISFTQDEYKKNGWGTRGGGSLVVGDGDFGSTGSMDLFNYDLTGVITYGTKTGAMSPVYFGGVTYGMGTTNVDIDTSCFESKTRISTTQYGFLYGIQILIDLGGIVVSPAYTMTSKTAKSESTNSTYISSACGGMSSSSFTDSESSFSSSSTSMSIDFLLKSAGITLSSILEAAKGDDSDTNTSILKFGWVY